MRWRSAATCHAILLHAISVLGLFVVSIACSVGIGIRTGLAALLIQDLASDVHIAHF